MSMTNNNKTPKVKENHKQALYCQTERALSKMDSTTFCHNGFTACQ
jgi:hypothetical protein